MSGGTVSIGHVMMVVALVAGNLAIARSAPRGSSNIPVSGWQWEASTS